MEWDELLRQQKQLDEVLTIIERNAIQVIASIRKKQEEIKMGLSDYQIQNAGRLKSLNDILDSISAVHMPQQGGPQPPKK